ncbi:uncharacterized protein F4807DRAFT_446035 [Annulohypoxylon truncatum]|uniref:uncharacterized protein n=1 Tax=Annulohypoxylon truncatum TaxID=327061 RepID=UPI0020083EEE|nr:uncharacterized protein F4807DRAFT_446035 [Annulohypoxylon truncatum]KAI1204741.1 hypothetical protein F4807DRAFT_446035 [Annulohypoxylon truncatum]
MGSIKVIKTLGVGKGITMDITVDETEPEDSINRYAMDTTCTGEETLYIPGHWHKDHAEHLSVLKGRIQVTLNGDKIILKAGDPALLVPRRAVHSLKSFEGEELVFRERPEPAGMYKAMFFNDIFSTGKFGGFWHLLRVFYDWETYLALPLYFQFFDEVFITIFGGIAHLFAPRKLKSL